jgi:REP element-mobilizing transposase RayT
MGKISPAAGSLATVIRSYKSVVTKQANRRDLPHGWQPNFYDRILRSDIELQMVSAYIKNNPAAWTEDEFYGEEGGNG